MNNAVLSHQRQGHQHLICEAANERGRESDESIGFDQFIQVDAQQFHCNAQVIPEVKMFSHFDNMVFFIRVLY
jgi:hypothetical protein